MPQKQIKLCDPFGLVMSYIHHHCSLEIETKVRQFKRKTFLCMLNLLVTDLRIIMRACKSASLHLPQNIKAIKNDLCSTASHSELSLKRSPSLISFI